ncbi:MAG: Ig-like domain-containing protein, partial [Rhodocyclales bacterium]|nr:Ig-like domain-containing protein [Rhodocyclales bacterium]
AIQKDDELTPLVFPAMNAVQVPATIQTLVAFTHPVDKESVIGGGVTLLGANGQPVSGVTRVDRDVVSFASSAPLADGESYTIKVAATVRNLAGVELGTSYESRFVTAIDAPQTAPQVAGVPASVCGTTLGIDGTAVPNARIQLDSGTWQFFATASATGAFHFDLPLSGQSGYQLVRVRTVGTDGSLSPSADVCVRVDCGGTRVTGATYDPAANTITILFSGAIDGTTLGVGSSVTLIGATSLPIAGSVSLTTPTTAIVTPERDLSEETFTLGVTTAVKDVSGNALTAPFSQTFFAGGGTATGNPGDGYLTGEVYDATTGRPLAGAIVTIGAEGLGSRISELGERNEELSRSQRLAGRESSGEARLSGDASVSEGRDVRTDATGPAGGGVDSVEYRGGSRPGINARLSAVSVDRDGIDRRSRNPVASGERSRVLEARRVGAADRAFGRDRENAARIAEVAASEASLAPSSQLLTPLTAVTDSRGRYTVFVPEGAHTIEASAADHTSAFRQIIVAAGAGVVPIDVRLEARGERRQAIAGEGLVLTHGGAQSLARGATLTVPSGSVNAGTNVTLTSVNAQSVAGLLPLGWSPYASAEVVVGDGAASGRTSQVRQAEHAMFGQNPLTATLTFAIDAAAITSAAQSLAAVRYDATRDEWLVVDAAVNITGNTATIPITRDGAYALVYPDKGTGLRSPAPASAGLPLQGVADPCATPNACSPLTKESFTLNPAVVAPDQRTTATLSADSVLGTQYSSLPPSGTAVQAYIDEELTLSDGSTITDPPFATDLILYRELDGAPAVATFHLAPSKRATEVFLQVGWEHIRVHPYPGRLDRGTLIGNEGGRVPGDGSVTVDIPAGATPEPVRAEVHPIADLTPFGSINGFTIVSAFEFELSRAGAPASSDLDGDGNPDPVAPVELFKSATATFNVPSTEVRQLVLAEVADASSYGRVFRLVSRMAAPVAGEGNTSRVSTLSGSLAPSSQPLPLDGIIREGRYLLLAANQPIAYATGLVRLCSATGPVASDARVAALDAQTTALGVVSITRATGIYATPTLASAPVLR